METTTPLIPFKYFGLFLKAQREGTRLNVRDAAKDMGISAPTISRVETGQMPDLVTYGKICKWLNVNPGVFEMPRK